MVVRNINSHFFKVQRLVKASHLHQITPPARGSGTERNMEGVALLSQAVKKFTLYG